jgi:hypothetical protein
MGSGELGVNEGIILPSFVWLSVRCQSPRLDLSGIVNAGSSRLRTCGAPPLAASTFELVVEKLKGMGEQIPGAWGSGKR